MKALQEYDITFSGLKEGIHHFEYDINQSFFQKFEYDEFNASQVKIVLKLEKKLTLLELFFSAKGTVNINCDITNEPYDQIINDTFELVVKFGEEYNNDNEAILILPHGAYQLNVAQYIYELIVLAIPAKRIHPGIEDGTLKSDILHKLEELSPNLNKKPKTSEETDPRWDNLKKLLTDKQH